MSDQPKWAWWVVGIVIPVVGIIVTVQVAAKSDSDDDTSRSTNNSAPIGTPASGGGSGSPAAKPATDPASPPAANAPAKKLSGPAKITLKPGADYIDLDTSSPFGQPGSKGADASVGFNLPDLTLGPIKSGDVVAIAPPDGPEPTRDDCAQAIAKRGTYTSGELSQGMRVCFQTDEGHIAYLRIAGVPTRTALTFEATVWE
ncbi:hypothetical protein B4N89_38010 [Embleya scabrispora]|uniref:Uncharacterized protein n=1 Tax=Embleya scabrispora TaxID=159449 RepID=A0A1T3NMF7_9ACTN|nr:hypothetical protein [Embleya scabrispora]OPC78016.1 hypothetical protein B4N89_38010 [Embleya scabrispora]